MKRIIAALALLLGISSPAYAISIIAGSDTGGAQGHAFSSGSTTVTITTTADSPIGALVVAMPAAAQSLTWTGCSDSAGNTYTAAFSTTISGAHTVRMFYSVNTVDLPIGGTVTCTANSSGGTKTLIAASFSGIAASPLDAAGTTGTGTSTTYTVGPTATLNYPGGANGEVLLGVVQANAAPPTNDPTFTSFGVYGNGGGTQTPGAWGYLIVSSNAAVTYAPSGTSQTYVGQLGAFIGNGSSTSVFHGLSSIGAGK